MFSENAIEVHGLSKCYQIYNKPSDRLKQMLVGGRKQYYQEFWALRDVSFKIKKGETVGIIGRNGSGKSTLLQMICGTLNPTEGEVKIHGRVAALLELGAGFNPEFTGIENIYMAASLYGLSRHEIDERFNAIVTFADIGDHVRQPVKTYSSGMYVRLAFAVIAHVDADVLVIDEALAVGDVFFTQKCMRFLRNFMKTGTVLFVSHDTASIKGLCNHVVWLDAGRLLEQGDPKTVCEHYLQVYYEAQGGEATSDISSCEIERLSLPVFAKVQDEASQLSTSAPPVPLIDQRLPYLNASNLRNDLRLFVFNPDAPSFGQGGSKVQRAAFCNLQGQPLVWVVGGEDVVLTVEALALQTLVSPIVGFVVKDRLGQALFGDNTWLTYDKSPCRCEAGQILHASFQFQMPRLPVGDYSVTLAIAEGTQQEHVQHQWIFDALTFRSESTSLSAGLVGIPMARIVMETRLPSSL